MSRPRPSLLRSSIAWLMAGVVAVGPVSSGALAQVAPPSPPTGGGITRTQYEACQARDEAGFRHAIEQVTVAALEKGIVGINYNAIVSEQWRRGDVDDVLARQVDAAIDELREETSWRQLIESLAYKETSQKLATSAAERVFRSDAMKKAIEGLATGVGTEIGKRIELATTDAAEPAAQCMRAFLGPRYGTAVARAVSQDAGREFGIEPGRNAPNVTPGQVLAQGGEGIAGTVLLIVRRQLSRMALGVGQRIVGAVLSRLVSVVAGGVGVVLIAKDIWELRHGVLPIIATEMKSAETREKVQAELAKSIGEQVAEHVREIGTKAADRVTEIWLEFRRAHAKVLELAEKDAEFRRFIDQLAPTKLPRLDEVVALILASEGEPAIMKRLGDGSLHKAVETLPSSALAIARDTGSLESGFKWWVLAGDNLDKVAATEIHRRNKPEQFTRASLNRLLAIGDRVAATRLASLSLTEREPLLEIQDRDLMRLGRALGEEELKSLSRYLTGLEKPAAQRLLMAVAEAPSKMTTVSASGVREAILASRDQSAAVGIMVRADDVFDVLQFTRDFGMVREGRVSPWVLWARYPVALSLLAGLGLLLGLMLWRLLFGRRTRIVVTPPGR